jgi:hypothetical protein
MSKGVVLQKMEHTVNGWIANGNAAALDQFIGALETQPDYLAVLKQHVPDVTDAEVAYLRRYWYDPTSPSCFWPGTDLRPVVRQGKARALRLARDHQPPIPIDCYWEPVSGNEVKVIVMPSDQQVTCIIRTPKPQVAGTHPPTLRPSQVPVWVVELDVSNAPVAVKNVQDL